MAEGMELYKVLDENRAPLHGGSGVWKPAGKWMPEIAGNLKPCSVGYHLCRRDDLVHWLGPVIWRAEHEGELIEDERKIVVRKARLVSRLETWNERTARLFACDCAEHVLHLYEAKYPDDSRLRNCINIARQVAKGDLPVSELDAAKDVAWDVAWDAARGVAWDVARGVAWDAARDAGWAAARGAEIKWQSTRLWQYLDGEI